MSSIASSDTDTLVPQFKKDDGNDGVGLSNPQLSRERRQMLDLVNRLHSTGVQVDIDLPQIAVIGSQSAGKSSLIESISGITLPRAAGTCTRCPTECRLSRSDNNEAWKCLVSLRRIGDGPARTQQFGDPIFEGEKSGVEDRIRRAQRAILNPGKPAKHFLEEDEDFTENELSFSKDCVSLQISGPNVADLSFCDLPGLIAAVGKDGHKSDIALVESLATSYIKKPSCIILLTVTCETDFQNQGAQELAKVHDPEGKRTIGVLTKPDRIPTGEEPDWLRYIRNEKEALENNWYCVKQPSSKDLLEGVDWAGARKRETEFFAHKEPWADLDIIYKKYLGTEKLVERLSSILSDLISKRLPEIQVEIERTIINTREALNKLPKEPSKDPQNEVANLLHQFAADLSKHIEGVPDEDGLLQTIRPAQERFRRALRATAPEFWPFEKRYAGKKTFKKPKFLSNEEEDVDSGDDDGGHSPLGYDMGPSSDRDDGSHSPSDYGLHGRSSGVYGIGTLSPDLQRDTGRGIYIDEVLLRAHQARTRELEGHFPFVVQETYIKGIIGKWGFPAHALCNTVYFMVGEHVKKIASAHFASFGQGGLEQRIKVLLQDHVRKCMERAEERITWLLELEDRPFSLNNHYLADYRDKFLSYYKGAREKDRNSELMRAIEEYTSKPIMNRNTVPSSPSGIGKVLQGLVEMGILGVKAEDLPKLIAPDVMEPALVIMADVRAYFQVAYKRFADNIPLAIDHELVRGVERGMLKTLNSGLGINGPEGLRICKELAQESQSIAGKREELLKKLERISAASQQLLQIGT